MGQPRGAAHVVCAVLTMMLWCAAARADLQPTPVELELFLDGVVASRIASGEVVGATVAVVKDGQVWFSKGYGLADRETGAPVDAATTLFRIGSVSKVLVWIAVMQQWHSGGLDFEADVNERLEDFKIPGTFPEPVTLNALMTHTPGFEDRIIGLFAHGPRSVGDFHVRLRTMLPRRVWAPGKYAAYSNYGVALAAHLVERASGVGWDEYAEQNILRPLDMASTTTRQPVPESLNASVSRGYRFDNGRYVDMPFEFVTLPPAGSVSATAPDMAKLMLELLRDGDSAVLASSARSKLFERAFGHDSRLNGVLHGMWERASHGQRIVGHDGSTQAFHSALVLYPDHRLGLFVSFNSARGAQVRDDLVNTFNDRWFGRAAVAPRTSAAVDLRPYLGWYRNLRAPETTPAKLVGLFGAVQVGMDEDANVTLPGAGGLRRFYPIDTDLFQQVDGIARIAFRDEHGVKTHLFLDAVPTIAFVRATWARQPVVNMVILAAVFGVFVLALLTWPAATFRRRNNRVPVPGETRATLLAFLQMLGCVAFVMAIAMLTGDGANEAVYGLPAWFDQARWLPVVTAVLLLLQVRYGYRAWAEGFWWLGRRVHYSLTIAAGATFVAWCWYWALLPQSIPV